MSPEYQPPTLKRTSKIEIRIWRAFSCICIALCEALWITIVNNCCKVPIHVFFLKGGEIKDPKLLKEKGKMPRTNIYHVLGLIAAPNFSLLINLFLILEAHKLRKIRPQLYEKHFSEVQYFFTKKRTQPFKRLHSAGLHEKDLEVPLNGSLNPYLFRFQDPFNDSFNG